MQWKKIIIVVVLFALVVLIYPVSKLGSEFMPTLNEGTLFYMLAFLFGMSITKVAELL